MNNIDKNKYFIYARKSSESDEKQIQSIDDQLNIMKQKAKANGVKIVDIMTESMSAKAPGRYRFNEMIQRINDGEANGIISWKLDRISRNPIDSGTIQYMLQTGKLNKVITNDREYNPIDAGLLMSVENGMSNQFLLDLSKNVKRGVKSKAEKGWFPGPAPLGYENELKHHTIIKDEDKFNLIQKMWQMMLSGNYSVNKITKLANDEWGLRTKKDCKVHKSTIYAIFHNVFYTGDFKWKGKIMKGNHPAMVSYEEYNRVQELLGKSGKAKLVKHNFAFTGIIRCSECGSMITAGNKYKHIKTTNTIKTYSYYWCTKKVKSTIQKCTQKAITQENLENQIKDILSSLEILPDFKEWAVGIIKKDFKDDIIQREGNLERLQEQEKQSRNKLDKLTDMLLNGRITDNIFDEKKINLELEIKQLKENIGDIDIRRKSKIETIEEMFNFVSKAKDSFENGDFDTKKFIFRSLGLEFKLKDGKIDIELYPWLKIIKDNPNIRNRAKGRFTPIKNSTSKVNTSTILNSSSKWQELYELHVRLSGSESEHSSN